MSSTRRPRCPAVAAHIMPAAPAPMTITSKTKIFTTETQRHRGQPNKKLYHQGTKAPRKRQERQCREHLGVEDPAFLCVSASLCLCGSGFKPFLVSWCLGG